MSSEAASGERRSGPAPQVFAGVDIGGTKTAVTLSCDLPHVLVRVEFPTLPELGPIQAVDRIVSCISELLRSGGFNRTDLLSIGISCGGPLDRHRGIIQAPPNLSTWQDVPITGVLHEAFGVRCLLDNDANAGAVAEYRFGAGRGTSNMIFLTMGTGIGAGIILNGQLFRGSTDTAGEIGHVRLTPSGPIGHNKAGSVEGWASGNGMAQAAASAVALAVEAGESTSLASLWKSNGLTARAIGSAARDGDSVARRIIALTGDRLGQTLAILVDLLNPDCIVIGGLAMRLGDLLLAPARKSLVREALPVAAGRCRVVPALLDESIGDIAALCVASGLTLEEKAVRI